MSIFHNMTIAQHCIWLTVPVKILVPDFNKLCFSSLIFLPPKPGQDLALFGIILVRVASKKILKQSLKPYSNQSDKSKTEAKRSQPWPVNLSHLWEKHSWKQYSSFRYGYGLFVRVNVLAGCIQTMCRCVHGGSVRWWKCS